MSNEAFVDVTWRGLEVGKRVKLHGFRPGDAYIDHTTPMPVGTQLALRTDEGLEIAVTVRRVHEQVGGSTETPGMQVEPALAGAAADWWRARCGSDPREGVVAKPTLTMSAVEVERVMAAVKDDGQVEAVDPDAGRTEVMAAVDPATLAAIEAAAAEEASDPRLVDDGRRTMVMSAVDVNAIVEAATADAEAAAAADGNGTGEEPSSDDAGASGSRPGGQGKKRRGGKRKRG